MLRRSGFALLTLGALLAGCGGSDTGEGTASDTTAIDTAATMAAGPMATASITAIPGSTNSIQGELSFTEENGGVRISGTVTGLTQGEHGMHIHEGADCAAPGTHFNPHGTQHGSLDADSTLRHLGDLGNIQAGADGSAMIDLTLAGATLHGANGIAGKPLVIHEGTDDLKTQPSGNSGKPAACGVIQMGGTGMSGMGADTTGHGGMPSDTASRGL